MDPVADAEGTRSSPIAESTADDPIFSANVHKGDRNDIAGDVPDDIDRCRICRGEGSKEEELFYPCKCNGSIKYVHQSCLVEWLAHSQKKHCELCKTPFRFTKLYDSNMPRSVPVLVFLRQAVFHAWRSLLTYGRFHLVVCMWAMWLPYCVRAVWRALFWLADGGWVDWRKRELGYSTELDGQEMGSFGWSKPASVPPSTESNLASLIMSKFSTAINRQYLLDRWSADYPYTEPVSFRLIRYFYHFLSWGSSTDTSAPSVSAKADEPSSSDRPPSWLSDVKMLNSLTPSSTFNNIVIDTLEGQIITVVIVVVFIVIFLIREWVMQQQQNIQFPVAPENPIPDVAADQPAEENDQRPQESANNPADGPAVDENRRQRVLLQPRGRLQRRATHAEGFSDQAPSQTASSSSGIVTHDQLLNHPNGSASSDRPRRPAMTPRGLTSAAEISRLLDESVTGARNPGLSGVQTFKDLWFRAGQNPSEVLRIIEEEHQNEDLEWLVTFMRKLEDTSFATKHEENEQQVDDKDEPAPDRPPSISGATSSSMSVEDGSRSDTPDRREHLDAMLTSNAEPMFPRTNIEDHPEIWHLSSAELINQPIATDSRPTSKAQENQVLAFPPHTTLLDEWDIDGTQEPRVDIDDKRNSESSPELPPELPSHNGEAQNQVEPPAETEIQTWTARLIGYMWDVPDTALERQEQPALEPDEHVVEDIAEEAPFVPAARRPNLLAAPNPVQANLDDQDVGGAGRDLDGNAADALEDLEDMEGFMELIGMQGPIFGLLQNGVFCTGLVLLTIIVAVWLPYILGKSFIILIARPISVIEQPLRFLSTLADMIVDLCIFTLTCSYYWTDRVVKLICSPIGIISPRVWEILGNRAISDASRTFAENALQRLIDASRANSGLLSRIFDIPRFSASAHQSLQALGNHLRGLLHLSLKVSQLTLNLLETAPNMSFVQIGGVLLDRFKISISTASSYIWPGLALATKLSTFNPLKLAIPLPSPSASLDYRLASWDSKDRSIAILFGYAFVLILGMLYLRLATAWKGVNAKGKVEGIVADCLYQAGGVTKVIVIISIEMIVFPLYCGIMLDIALLPLFQDASIASRAQFAISSPSISIFLHWFVGTCYMFHFALFVSMCRKIFRKGALFFIRDPDDPTFHPVRDVLERSVATQLYKISFSALVYGVLIVACLGGVVWSVGRVTSGILPIKWTSSEPLIEFPFDLLFYNVLVPLAVRYCKPSNAFSTLYEWWYRQCASWLRLSSFLFNEVYPEERYWQKQTIWSRWAGRVAHLFSSTSDASNEDSAEIDNSMGEFYGKWARVPYSDQLRIPKGLPTFFEVDRSGRPLGLDQRSKTFLDSNFDSFTKVYLPPNFRLRIAILTILIWLFSVALGFSFTILPLVLGRFLLTTLSPLEIQLNDTYAFATGFCVLGGTFFSGHRLYMLQPSLKSRLAANKTTVRLGALRARGLAFRILRILYTYSAFSILIPALTSLLMQAYIILPLFTYLEAKSFAITLDISETTVDSSAPESTGISSSSSSFVGPQANPLIHIIQEWTLGLLYTKAIGRFILWSGPSRPASALRGIIRRGWLNPDAGLATRGFILPSMLLVTILLALPLACGWIAGHTALAEQAQADEFFLTCIYRFSYPAVLGIAACTSILIGFVNALKMWRKKVKDEVYLIGERLHNYGDSKRSGVLSDKSKEGKGKEKEVVERQALVQEAQSA